MAKVVRRTGTQVTVEVTVDLQGTLLEMEGAIQEASNAVGRCATEVALTRFDTDGSPIRLGAMKLRPHAGVIPRTIRARPPFALERLELIDEQQVIYRLPRTQRNGTTALSLTPLELIDHLAALIPPPRRHRHRYHGVLAPNSPLRAAATAYGRDAADDPSAPDEVPAPLAAPAPNARSPSPLSLGHAAGAAVRVPTADLPQPRGG